MSILDRVKDLMAGRRPPIPEEPVSYRPIGVVHNSIKVSRPSGWEDVTSEIILRDDLIEALDGLADFSHVIVLFHMDQVPLEEQRLRLTVGTDAEDRGVFATRSQRRPNPIGVAVVPIVQLRNGVLRVSGLDAIDGTPVLDLKPYLPSYDSMPDAKLAPWALR